MEGRRLMRGTRAVIVLETWSIKNVKGDCDVIVLGMRVIDNDNGNSIVKGTAMMVMVVMIMAIVMIIIINKL